MSPTAVLSCCTVALRPPRSGSDMSADLGALGGTRTPNLLIRSQMLYPLSYERRHCSIPRAAPWLYPVQIAHASCTACLSV